ncbi:MAG: 50S ribosomal protein L11 methyltransferase [Myxococcales bacterium]|nr:50S ribosomal protein L11 methyltransferase [Myxococcales bacterium]MDP3500721.1 50S ribosomal protein L11 methyltransferase [Myxococcales bacterium]
MSVLAAAMTQLSRSEPLPGLHVWTAPEPVSLWVAMEALQHRRLPPPFWAHVWPGSLALARHLETRQLEGVRVLDFACGGAVAGLAAARRGAVVEANDIDPLALEVSRLNAELNGVTLRLTGEDLIGADTGWPLVLVGDVFYEAPLVARLVPWLDQLVARGAEVLVGDPGRQFFPKHRVQLVAQYEVACLPAWDSVNDRPATVWRWRAP